MTHFGLADLPLGITLLMFAVAAAGVWFAGVRLTLAADEISDRLRIGQAFMGLVFLASATELPEIVTTVTAALVGNATLVLNNMFGGIALQTTILAIADAAVARFPLTVFPRSPTPILEACALALLLCLLQSTILIGETHLIFGLGISTVLLASAYTATIYLFWSRDKSSAWRPIKILEERHGRDTAKAGSAAGGTTTRRLCLSFAVAAAAILVFGVLLVTLAEVIAEQTGLGASFIGVTLLAGATSLPELSTTLTAVRLGAYTMAISNIFGSNLIMLFLLLPADAFYRPGPILDQVDKSASFALTTGLAVTLIYIIGLVARRPMRAFGMGFDSIAVLAVYAGSLIALYGLRD